MKLATIGAPHKKDGILCLVSRDLKWAVYASPVAQTLQEALDNWQQLENPLREIAAQLEEGKLKHAFKLPLQALNAPLPRAYQWLDGSAYLSHVALVRKSRGVVMPADALTNPLMYQGGSDVFLGPFDSIPLQNPEDGLDFEAEVAVICDDVPMGTPAQQATDHIKLIVLVNDISLRNLALKELTKGFGFVQSKPPSSFSPLAITPDELGAAWQGSKVHLPLYTYRNNVRFGEPNAGIDMTFSFADLIAHAAKTRNLAAGTIIGSGTVSNQDKSHGASCIIEKRTIETLEHGEPQTPYLQAGETVQIEMLNEAGENLFGSIKQTVQAI